MIGKENIISLVKWLGIPLFGLLFTFFVFKGWSAYTRTIADEDKMQQAIQNYHAVDKALEDMKICKKGDSKACLRTGIYYLNGKFITPNRKKAGKYLYRACRLNNPVGCYELGTFWKSGRKARKYYKKACSLDYALGCDALEKMKKHK